jgi:hypothetical protein
MLNQIDCSINIIDVDQLIRRALQDRFHEIQPPASVWGNIQRYLEYKKPEVKERLRQEYLSKSNTHRIARE